MGTCIVAGVLHPPLNTIGVVGARGCRKGLELHTPSPGFPLALSRLADYPQTCRPIPHRPGAGRLERERVGARGICVTPAQDRVVGGLPATPHRLASRQPAHRRVGPPRERRHDRPAPRECRVARRNPGESDHDAVRTIRPSVPHVAPTLAVPRHRSCRTTRARRSTGPPPA
jgi:hypothetical protein